MVISANYQLGVVVKERWSLIRSSRVRFPTPPHEALLGDLGSVTALSRSTLSPTHLTGCLLWGEDGKAIDCKPL